MIRKIIQIDEEKCNGCGACASACHEGAIGMADGKAKLLRDDYCDGLGDCLPACPAGAISFVEREAAAYDEAAVLAAKAVKRHEESAVTTVPTVPQESELRQLLVAADCTAYAYASFHQDFIKGHITLVGCPKLDAVDYAVKLTEIIRNNDIRSVTVVRMEVPCCRGIENAVKTALRDSGKLIPWNVAIIAADGSIIERV